MRKTAAGLWGLGLLSCALLFPPRVLAIVGQAEQFDPYEQEKLEDFHKTLVQEETLQTRGSTMSSSGKTLQQLKEQYDNATGEEKDAVMEQMELLKRELLALPKRDRFKFETVSSYTLSSNATRSPIGEEQNDQIFLTSPAAVFDLSGRKTRLFYELGGGKQWSLQFPKNTDFWYVNSGLRYNRRYFKKVLTSANSSLLRHVSKSVEINQSRVRYDGYQQSSTQVPIFRKLSLNTDYSLANRYFPQEAFDQDTTKQFNFAPSLFYQRTPKTRFSLGYIFGANRIRSKAGDTNSHSVNVGYFGRLTRKSSVNANISYVRQTPRSNESATSSAVNAGLGYILQLTPKTQMLLQFIRSQQNTSTDPDTGVAGVNVTSNSNTTATTKNDDLFTNESLSMAFNSRLLPRLNATLALTVSHFKSTTQRNDTVNMEGELDRVNWNLPMQFTVNWMIRRWLFLTTGYTFAYRIGYEVGETNRVHEFRSIIRMVI